MDTETTKQALDLMDEVIDSIVVDPNIRINQNNILKKIHQHSKKSVKSSSAKTTTVSSTTTQNELSKSSDSTNTISDSTNTNITTNDETSDDETSEPLIERSSELKVTAMSIGSILDTKTHNSTETHLSETDRAHNLALTKTSHRNKEHSTRTPTFII